MKHQVFSAFLILALVGCENPSNEGNVFQKEVKSFSSSYLASKTSYFIIEGDSIIGNGKKIWEKIFEESEFVVFGERHNSAETSKLIEVLIPEMSKSNFKTLCLEVGPHSALKLSELMQPPHRTVNNLRIFNSRYYDNSIDDFPIPFFSGVEDAQFLKSASTHGMELWGLDQEYYYSVLFLTDRLLEQNKDSPRFQEIELFKQAADSLIMKSFIEENNSDEEIDVFGSLINEPVIINFFSSIENNPESSQIISDLKISWDIYSRWRQDSHADRVSYMRNNFRKNYKSALRKGESPKVFLKVGQLHASQIISNGAYDLGHYVNELALRDKKVCTNINSWTRFYLEEGVEVDYLEEYPVFFGRYKLFMEQAKKSHWAIIDLKSIRNDVKNQRIELPENGDFHKINALIQGYDYQVILPMDKEIKLNVN